MQTEVLTAPAIADFTLEKTKNGQPAGVNYFSGLQKPHRKLLQKLERRRKRLGKQKFAWSLHILLVIVMLAGLWFADAHLPGLLKYEVPVMIGFTAYGIAGTFFLTFFFSDRDEMNEEYRKNILRLLVESALPGWKFASHHNLTIEDVMGTGLVNLNNERINRVIKEDFFTGQAGGSVARIFEITLEERIRKKYRKWHKGSNRYSEPVTYFFGYLFNIISPHEIKTALWVFPRKKKSPGFTDEWVIASEKNFAEHSGKPSFRINDSAFDEQFICFADDIGCAKNFLNAEERKKITVASALLPGDCAFCFKDKHIYVMAGFPDDPLHVEKGMRIPSEIENDHVAQLHLMHAFVSVLA